MGEKVTQITQRTLMPLALVVVLVGAVWGLATDRQKAIGQIAKSDEKNVEQDKRITAVELDVKSILDGVRRMEIKLGTLPASP
jgi:hypothetical protein